MSNPRYTEEFKIEAVKQVADRGTPLLKSPLDWACRHTVCINGSSATISPPPSGSRMMISRLKIGD